MFPLLLSVLLCVLAAGCVNDDPAGGEYSLLPGDMMPQFEVVTTAGDTVTTDSFAGSRSVIILFSPDCPDCLRELPRLQAMYEHGELADSAGVKWLCISRSATREAVMDLWEMEALTMPVSVQEDAVVFHLFASSGVPRGYVFGPDLRMEEELPLER